MNTTVRAARRESPPGAVASGAVASVRVAVADAELNADVSAVLAALALQVTDGDGPSDVLVTDSAEVGDGSGGARVVRVAPDRDRVDDDEVIHLPSGTGDLVAVLMTPIADRSGPSLVVVGAVGGCGASTLAAALAIRAASSQRTLLVETDPHGTGVDLLLGAESEPGLRVEEVRAELGGPDPDALWGAVPKPRPGLGVLARSRNPDSTGSRAPGSDGAAGAARSHRGSGGLVVVDAGDLAGGRAGFVGADIVVVTRADLQGAVAAGRAVRSFPGAALVVRTGRGDPLHAADVAGYAGAVRWHVLPELGGVRRAIGTGGLAEALDRGRAGRVRGLAAVADALLQEVLADGRA